MSANVPLPPVATDNKLAGTDEVPAGSGVQIQLVKLLLGALGVNGGVVGLGNPLPVTMRYWPSGSGNVRTRFTAVNGINATNLKNTGGKLVRFRLQSVAAYDIYLHFSDVAAAPTPGTDPVAWVYKIPAGALASENLVPDGEQFTNGVSVWFSKGIADSDATAIAAGDLYGFITTN